MHPESEEDQSAAVYTSGLFPHKTTSCERSLSYSQKRNTSTYVSVLTDTHKTKTKTQIYFFYETKIVKTNWAKISFLL